MIKADRIKTLFQSQTVVRRLKQVLTFFVALGLEGEEEGGETAVTNTIPAIATTTLPLADRVLLSKLGFRPVAETSSSAPDLPATSDFVELDPQGKG